MSDSTMFLLMCLFALYVIGSAIGSAAKAAGSVAKTAGTAAIKNPGSTVRGGLELWKFFNK